jgi:hypothetical protein
MRDNCSIWPLTAHRCPPIRLLSRAAGTCGSQRTSYTLLIRVSFIASAHTDTSLLSRSTRVQAFREGTQFRAMEMEGDAADAASAAAARALGAERVDRIKARLAPLLASDDELGVELGELQAEWERAGAAHDEVDALERVTAKRETVRAEIEATRNELDAAVNAPVSGGHDPTEWLPDELLLMVLERLPWAALCSGACERVCQRWACLMGTSVIVRRKRDGRWTAYNEGTIQPRTIDGHTGLVYALAVGLDGRIYSGSDDRTIMVWSGESGAHLQTLVGHTRYVGALAVGLDGAIYSGSADRTVMVWSGTSGAHVRTLEGHTGTVMALTVGLDGKIYSGSVDTTIRAWAGDDDITCMRTLVGHTGWVHALAVGKDGAIYSGSFDRTIRVWSGEDGSHLRTLVGHASVVSSLAVAPDGRVYSGSLDNTIRAWSPDDGTHLHTLTCHTGTVKSLAIGPDGKVFSGSSDGTVRVWSGESGRLLHTLGWNYFVAAIALRHDGGLYSGGADLHIW